MSDGCLQCLFFFLFFLWLVATTRRRTSTKIAARVLFCVPLGGCWLLLLLSFYTFGVSLFFLSEEAKEVKPPSTLPTHPFSPTCTGLVEW